MFKLLLEMLVAVPHFRGKSRVARSIGRVSGPIWLRSRYGPEFRFYPRDATSAYATLGGGYDDVVSVLRQLRPGMHFVDIGANAGIMSLIASGFVAEGGCCYAFEPNPFILSRLAENVLRNRCGNVRILPFALSGETAFHRMSFDEFHSGQAHLSNDSSGNLDVLTVNISGSFPELTEEICARPFIVKIDVEGHEEHVLNSIDKLLSHANCRTVVVEIESVLLRRAGSSPQRVFDILTRHGFCPTSACGERDRHNEVFSRS